MTDAAMPMEPFETWLLRRVAHVVEAGEVPANLLIELRAEFEATRERSQTESLAAAIQHIGEDAGVAGDEARSALFATFTTRPISRWRLGATKPRFDACSSDSAACCPDP